MESSRAELQDFDDVVSIHWSCVHRFILASVRDADAALTLTQDCFLRAYSGWSTFRGESSVRTWLLQIGINLVRDSMRSRRIRFWKRLSAAALNPGDLSNHLPEGSVSPEGRALLKEQVAIIWRVCGRLPERQRTVFLLRFVEEMDLLEIAAATGLKEGTVKTHLFRALETIRGRLERSK